MLPKTGIFGSRSVSSVHQELFSSMDSVLEDVEPTNSTLLELAFA